MGWPTTDDPKTELVTLRLTVGQAADLDTHAQANGKNRSAFVRDCVDRVIAHEKRVAKKQKAARKAGTVGGTP